MPARPKNQRDMGCEYLYSRMKSENVRTDLGLHNSEKRNTSMTQLFRITQTNGTRPLSRYYHDKMKTNLVKKMLQDHI